MTKAEQSCDTCLYGIVCQVANDLNAASNHVYDLVNRSFSPWIRDATDPDSYPWLQMRDAWGYDAARYCPLYKQKSNPKETGKA